jgi:hypothetical protein
MSETNQPQWQFIGHVGDIDPISHGGGLIYKDTTGKYCPEMTWFEPAPEEEWKEKGELAKVTIYRILLENDSTKEWWYKSLNTIAEWSGISYETLLDLSTSPDPMEKAWVYEQLLRYFGPENFDSDPTKMTEAEAEEKYAIELAQIRRRRSTK